MCRFYKTSPSLFLRLCIALVNNGVKRIAQMTVTAAAVQYFPFCVYVPFIIVRVLLLIAYIPP